MRQHGADAVFRSSNRAIDAFMRQQQRAFDLVGLAAGLQWRLKIDEVRQIDEFIESGGEEKGGGSTCRDYPLC